MIGGTGEKVTLRLVARHAQGWHAMFPDNAAQLQPKIDALRHWCEVEGRDPNDIEWGVGVEPDELRRNGTGTGPRTGSLLAGAAQMIVRVLIVAALIAGLGVSACGKKVETAGAMSREWVDNRMTTAARLWCYRAPIYPLLQPIVHGTAIAIPWRCGTPTALGSLGVHLCCDADRRRCWGDRISPSGASAPAVSGGQHGLHRRRLRGRLRE